MEALSFSSKGQTLQKVWKTLGNADKFKLAFKTQSLQSSLKRFRVSLKTFEILMRNLWKTFFLYNPCIAVFSVCVLSLKLIFAVTSA